MAIDTEFTGLALQSQSPDVLDTSQEKYSKLRQTAQNFTISQFGLSAFQYSSEENKFVARTWNFYLFPHPFMWWDKRFTCQASSLQFLVQHNFDFNKFIGHGISYLSYSLEAKLRPNVEAQIEKLKSPQDAYPNIVVTNQRDIEFVEGVRKAINEWQEGEMVTPLEFKLTNSFLRRLVYQEVRTNYPGLSVEKVEGSWDRLLITPVSDAGEKQRKLEAMIAAKRQDLEDAIGFRRIIEEISRSKKPVVGHNLFLDLLYSYTHFVDYLPADVVDFKKAIHQIFPTIYDTKFLAAYVPGIKDRFISTGLEDVYKSATAGASEPLVEHADGFNRYVESEEFAHEAGFDAYMTGVAFAHFLSWLANDKREGEGSEGGLSLAHPLLTQHANKLSQHGVIYCFHITDLESKDDFSSVIHLSYAPDTQPSDIQSFIADIPFQVRRIDAMSALLIVSDSTHASRAFKVLSEASKVSSKARRLQLQVRSYKDYLEPKREWHKIVVLGLIVLFPVALALALSTVAKE